MRRSRQRWVWLAAALTLLASVVPGSSAAQLWIDDLHAWDYSEDLQSLIATSDGGRSWRRIFGGVGDLGDIAPTAPGVGLVSPFSTRTGGLLESYWTLDDGKHWFLSETLRSPSEFEGHGSFLFWARGSQLLRVRSWPPRGPRATCRGEFDHSTGFRGSICYTPNEPLRSDVVAEVREGFVHVMASLPSGVLAFIWPHTEGAPFRVLVRRLGMNRLVSLPRLAGDLEQFLDFSSFRLQVDYPRLTILVVHAATRHPLASWESTNGGRTWHLR